MTLWDRRQHRVSYEAPIRLLSPNSDLSIDGTTANVSERGVFVVSSHALAVGTELWVDLPVAGQTLTLRGRVAWVTQLPTENRSCQLTGMGIAFVHQSSKHTEALRQAIETMSDQTKQVIVRFEGMQESIRARAVFTTSGLQLRTALPFLRRDSAVDLYFAEDGSGSAGVLKQVALDFEEDVPRLAIGVELPENLPVESLPIDRSSKTADETHYPQLDETHYPQLRVLEQELREIHAREARRGNIAPPLARGDVVTQQSITEQLYPTTGCATEPLDPVLSAIDRFVETPPKFDETPADRLDSSKVVRLEQQARTDQPPTEISQAQPTAQTSQQQLPSPPAAPQRIVEPAIEEQADEPAWVAQVQRTAQLGDLDADREDFWHEIEGRRQRIWWWAAALAMAGVAIASMLQAGWLGGKATEQNSALAKAPAPRPALATPLIADAAEAEPAVVPPLPTQAPAPTPPISQQPAATSAPTPSVAKPKLAETPKANPQTAVKVAPAAPAKVQRVAAARAEPASGPQLAITPHGIKIRIPLRGSIARADHYPLASPTGVSINLPQAKPTLDYGMYPIGKGGVKAVWVRKNPSGGAQVRIFFSTRRAHRVNLSATLLEVAIDDRG